MRVLIVLSLDVDPNNLDEVSDALLHIDPPTVPHFSGQARLVVEPESLKVEEWLDE